LPNKVPALFSDRHRWIKIGLPGALLLAMCIYSATAGPKRMSRFADYLREPARFDGASLLVQFTQIKRYDCPNNRFTVQDIWGNRIEVVGTIPPGQMGCFISFEALFKKPGYLVLGKKWHIYSSDTLKLIVSAVALVGVALFFLRRFRFNPRRLRFEERRQCQTS